ncbi:hypothetical protein BX666DRAFT_1859842 [Dichotomocladium elegans]|nr:hypothetical protein BX666DRAFT_1859842 [Dichotomocladium elegans]
MRLRSRRQHERWLRWQDTPTRVVTCPRGFCFVSARFMWEWERFVEGWRTDPPLEEKINCDVAQTQAAALGPSLDLRFDPFLPETTDLLMVSTETWEYLLQTYSVAGPKISKGKDGLS